jgi:HK97 family phage portal protein
MMMLASSFDCMPGAAAPLVSSVFAEADTNGYERGNWHVLAGPTSESGQIVTPSTALSHGPVYQGVNLLAGDVGQLPWHKMVRRGRNRDKDREHPLEYILTKQPNRYQTPAIWKETMMAWAILWGNGISYVERERGLTGPVTGIYPLLPDRTGYIKEGGEYFIWSLINNQTWWFSPEELFHIRGLATNGFWGESFVQRCANVVGHGLALRAHGNAVFKNGARPSVALKLKKVLSPDARAQLRKEWEARHTGANNAGSVVILQEDMELDTYSLSNIEAQWLDAVKLDPVQIAGLLQIPPHMLGALENSAVRANLEEQTRGYFQRSLGRHLNKFCEEADRVLLSDKERRSTDPAHYFRFFVEAFLKGDIKTRYQAYALAVRNRIRNPNECREDEDLNPYEGGDEFLNPSIDLAGGSSGGGDGEGGDEGDRDDALRNLVRGQCLSLANFESHKLEWAAKQPQKFLAWADKFYGSTFLENAEQRLGASSYLASTLGFAGDWEAAVREHVSASQAEILAAIPGDTLAGELSGLIATLKPSITARADVMARRILGDDERG